MRLLFAGSPAAAVPTLTALLGAGHDVVAVATNPDAPASRGRGLEPSPVAAEARRRGIQLLQPRRAREPWFAEAVGALELDAAVIVAWGCLIPDALLAVPRHGWVNVHFSLLPAWRGAAPVHRALMAGCATTGVTTFRLVHDLDAGPVWRSQPVDVAPGETSGELLGRLAGVGAGVLLDTLGDIAAGVPPRPQPQQGVTLAPKVTTDDARVDWTLPAARVCDLVRAVTPHPGAWTTLAGTRLKIAAVRPAEGVAAAPGEVVVTKSALLVGAGDGPIEVLRVQAAGKPAMAGADWARGARPARGARCE